MGNVVDHSALSNGISQLDAHAQRIRDLVAVARGCIIEIGRELIEASGKFPDQDEWAKWLDREFGWRYQTARNYMNVAKAFSTPTRGLGSEPLTIDATALYALAAPEVPQSARDEAVEHAIDGERITKTAALAMIAKANADFEAKAREVIEAERQHMTERVNAAINDATAELVDDNDRLQAEIHRIRQSAERLDVNSIAKSLCAMTGRQQLGPNQWTLLAQLLNKRIAVGKRAFDPVSAEQLKLNEEKLRVAARITEALETLASSPPANTMRDLTWPVQRKQHRRLINPVLQWVATYEADLREDNNEASAAEEDGATDPVEGSRRQNSTTDKGKRRQIAK